jgi:hypothetical protein
MTELTGDTKVVEPDYEAAEAQMAACLMAVRMTKEDRDKAIRTWSRLVVDAALKGDR